MKDIKYIIADNVKLYRKRKNLIQADLSLDTIKRIEGGKKNNVIRELYNLKSRPNYTLV